MKGYCKCGKVIDEVQYTQFGMCEKCYLADKKVRDVITHTLKDYGLDWIFEERGSKESFNNLIEELILALKRLE